MPINETRKQQIVVASLAAALLLLTVSTAGFLLLRESGGNGASSDAYKNVTFTDAVLACEQSTKNNYNQRIKNLMVDSHSSRYDNAYGRYKIFLKADMISEESGEVALHYVNCFVNSSSGDIQKYEVFEDSEEEVSPVKGGDTNAFGWPK